MLLRLVMIPISHPPPKKILELCRSGCLFSGSSMPYCPEFYLVDILTFIGSNPWFQRVTSRPNRTVRKTTRYRPPRSRPDRVLCRFCSITTNFQPAFSLRGLLLSPCGQGLELRTDRAKKEAVGCPVLHLLRVRRPGGPGKSAGLAAEGLWLSRGQILAAARRPAGSPDPARR